MSEKQKTRLYKVAKEFNLSHDTVIEFLVKKGYDVKNHMSVVDEEMLDLLERHFKKDKAEAERLARKRREFDEQDRRRRGEEEPAPTAKTATREETVAPAVVETAPEKKEVPPLVEETTEIEHAVVAPPPETEIEVLPAPVPEVVHVAMEEGETREQVEVAAVEPPAVEVESTPEAVEAAVGAVVPAAELTVVEETIAERGTTAPEVEEPIEIVEEQTDLDVSIEASVPKMGLTVRGKIDLDALEAKRAKIERKKETGAVPAVEAEEKPKHKKKKKKKIVAGGVEPLEDTAEAEKKKAAKRGKKGKVREVDAGEVDDAIRRTIAAMGDYGTVSARAQLRKKKRARREEEEKREIARAEQEKRTLKIYEYATVSEIASMMNVTVAEVISSLIKLGIMASINQRLDLDTITLVASEFGYDVEHVELEETDVLEDKPDDPATLVPRPPIVTIMGHVDHGKTSLLDYIRKTNVVAGESGGITQHIGAYMVELPPDARKITFLDTPGHEAFTAMRARGAQVTDIVVLVVAADDSVMPQTVEAISHALAANVPIIVAINKIDKPGINIDRIKQQLADRHILVEEWGGKYAAIPISAKTGQNVPLLLERILLEADILDLRANPNREARGVILESKMDKNGITATVLVQKGTLRIGDSFIAGSEYGRVRLLRDERGNRVESAPPSTPVQVLGFNGLPQAGDSFVVVPSDREARFIAGERQMIKREAEFRARRRKTLDDISEQIRVGGVGELAVIVKADVDGSLEALSDSLGRLSTDEVRVHVIHAGVGAISESDVLLASASGAIIIGFRVRPNLNARKLAETEDVDIRLYDIIYNAISDVKSALEGMLRPTITEKVTATVLVRETFKISKVGTIAGCYVQEGKIHRHNHVRLLRDGVVVYTGTISSLKRFKDDVREVEQNFECGIGLDGFNDIKVGDVIEAFERVETKRTLS
ncbi:MAG: translation initiation factor IF-2 [Bacteroidota bacterium]|nr:translation initiation factor IF-2 [Bacteroidota bacterium]